MDVLSDILSSIHLDGSVLSEIVCGGRWGIDIEPRNGIPFHYVIEGKCWLLSEDLLKQLHAGDLVIASQWPSHALASAPDTPLVSAENLVTLNGYNFWTQGTFDRPLILHAGKGITNARILSGVFSVQGRGARILVDQLPSLMHLNVSTKNIAPQLKMALEFVHIEGQSTDPGYVAVANRMMDLLFVQVLRAAIAQFSAPIGLLAGLSDQNISRALAAIHAAPSSHWTVASLAAEACLSRTTFAERFRKTVGLTPIQYVVRWRMTVAEELLVESDLTIEQIRHQLGYENSFVFARAFRAHSGFPPREYRRRV